MRPIWVAGERIGERHESKHVAVAVLISMAPRSVIRSSVVSLNLLESLAMPSILCVSWCLQWSSRKNMCGTSHFLLTWLMLSTIW